MIVGSVPLMLGGLASGTPVGDPNFSSVKLLLHFEGSNGSTIFTDSSLSPKTFGSTGASLTTAVKASGLSSGNFNGSQAISTPANAEFNIAANQDFCIEAKVNPTNYSGVWFSRQIYGDLAVQLYCYESGFGGLIRSNDDRVVRYFGGGTAPALGVFNHCAMDRRNGILRFFLNGILQTSHAHTLSVSDANAPISIGALNDGWSTVAQPFTGRIDEFRFSTVSRYAENFIPSADPFPDWAVPPAPLPAILNNVSLLCNFSNNGSDATGKQATLSGTPTFSDGQMVLSGTNHLTFADHAQFDYGAGNLTIEFFATIGSGWVGSDSYLTLMNQMPIGSEGSANILYIYFESRVAGNNRGWSCKWFSPGWTPVVVLEEAINASANYLDNVEYHIAIVRNGNSFKLYCNGVEKASTTYAGALPNPSGLLRIGGDTGPGGNWRGSLSAVRITREALYTAPFTPPVNYFPES